MRIGVERGPVRAQFEHTQRARASAPYRDRVGVMANQNGDRWPLGLVSLIVYVAVGMAVGYAIALFWMAYDWRH